MPSLEATAVIRARDETARCYLDPNAASAIEVKPEIFWTEFQRELAASPVLDTPARLVGFHPASCRMSSKARPQGRSRAPALGAQALAWARGCWGPALCRTMDAMDSARAGHLGRIQLASRGTQAKDRCVESDASGNACDHWGQAGR
jgi:hypothetical protein